MDSSPTTRSGKEILNALKPFASEVRWRSWFQILVTFLALGLFLSGPALTPWWPLRCLFAVAAGLVMVRAFILFHDFMHGAILRDSTFAKILMYALGVLMLTPPRSWRESHNYHHAHVGRLGSADDISETAIATDIGAFPLLSTGCIIHHLNSHIPFYRLREAMAAVPELQHPTTTRLRLRDIIGCFRANLWDQQNHRMVSYRDAAA